MLTDASGGRLLLMQHDQNGPGHDGALAGPMSTVQLPTVIAAWQADCVRGTYEDFEDLNWLNCERATARRKNARGSRHGNSVTSLLAMPGTTTRRPRIKAS